MPEEIWRDVVGYEGLYRVSNLGRVKAIRRPISYTNRYGYTTHTFTKTHLMSLAQTGHGYKYGKGYIFVNFNINGKQTPRLVHRLVAEAFIPNPDKLPEVNHIDGDKSNNYVSNLEWASRGQNMHHAACVLRSLKGIRSPVPIKCLDTGETFSSTSEAARTMGIDRRGLSQAIIDGKPFGGCRWTKV